MLKIILVWTIKAVLKGYIIAYFKYTYWLCERGICKGRDCMLLHIKWVCQQNPVRGLQLKKALFPSFLRANSRYNGNSYSWGSSKENPSDAFMLSYNTEGKQQLEAWFDLFVWLRLSRRHWCSWGVFSWPSSTKLLNTCGEAQSVFSTCWRNGDRRAQHSRETAEKDLGIMCSDCPADQSGWTSPLCPCLSFPFC